MGIEPAIEQFRRNGRFPMAEIRWITEINELLDIHYLFHSAWAARILARSIPEKHVDISSSTFFNLMVSAFVPIDFYEFRSMQMESWNNLKYGWADLTKLSFPDDSIESLSCMHTVEHIGLGRYGDEIDPDGDLKAISELKRVLKGDLLFVVPIGKPKLVFNAHRIYSYDQIIRYFAELKLVEYMLITDSGKCIKQALEEVSNKQNYGCGCFLFRKDLK